MLSLQNRVTGYIHFRSTGRTALILHRFILQTSCRTDLFLSTSICKTKQIFAPTNLTPRFFLLFSLFFLYAISISRNSGMTNSSVVVELKTDKLNEEDGLLNKKNATEQVRPIEP